jgi:hypothetical protein
VTDPKKFLVMKMEVKQIIRYSTIFNSKCD